MVVPPPSPALERALADLRPSGTRRPLRTLGGIALASLAYAALVAWKMGIRGDLRQMPLFPFVLYGASCLATFVALLACALIPPRGQVLPSGSVARRITTWTVSVLVALDLLVAFTSPGGSALGGVTRLEQVFVGGWPCLASALGIVSVPILLGLWSVRRLIPIGGWRVLMALGGAAGALAGLILHLHCPVQDPAHVGLVHGTVLIVPAAILAATGLAPRERRVSRLFAAASGTMNDREGDHGC